MTPAAKPEAGTDAQRPLISVIIPAYNRAWSLRAAVQSVFGQTYRPIECLVCDDGSTDDTPALARQLEAEAPASIQVRYLHKENGGANTARNLGLRESRGSFICFLDSDDLLLPDSIEVRARVLRGDPDADLCYGLASLQDEDGRKIRTIGAPWPAPGEARIAPYSIHTSAPLARRALCERCGPWREDDTFGQEYEYFARLKFFARKVVFIDRVLSLYIRHENGSILDNGSVPFSLAIFRMLLAVKTLILYGPADSPAERKELGRMFHALAKQLHGLGDRRNACAALEESLLLHRNPKAMLRWLACRLPVGRVGGHNTKARVAT